MNENLAANMGGPFLLFDIGTKKDSDRIDTFAIDVSNVFQVIELGHIAPVPLAPEVVLGILNHHGNIVTIVDPAKILNLSASSQKSTQAVILRQNVRSSTQLGFKVSHIWGILPRNDLLVVPIPPQECIAWAAQVSLRLVKVLALTSLLESLSRLFGNIDSKLSLQGVTV
ncbi:MAG: chemotaxis protein CheW [Deltaproteobacteria bacterium]|nr:chemotaxis protein CheW [Deltaproteobacteria bacterium]